MTSNHTASLRHAEACTKCAKFKRPSTKIEDILRGYQPRKPPSKSAEKAVKVSNLLTEINRY